MTRPITAAIVVAMALAGCEPAGEGGEIISGPKALRDENAALKARVAEQSKQIGSLQALGAKRLDKLFHVTRIELGRYTGGIDIDKKPGHDGVRVYVKPIDQHGSTLKAAGSVTVQVYDLALPAEKTLIGTYTWTVDQAAKMWKSGFVAYQYSFTCPWKTAPPRHRDLTVRVTFLDYLTGKTFTAQKLCKVDLPSAARK